MSSGQATQEHILFILACLFFCIALALSIYICLFVFFFFCIELLPNLGRFVRLVGWLADVRAHSVTLSHLLDVQMLTIFNSVCSPHWLFNKRARIVATLYSVQFDRLKKIIKTTTNKLFNVIFSSVAELMVKGFC